MLAVRLDTVNDAAEWRALARRLLVAGVTPEAVCWSGPAEASTLFDAPVKLPPAVEGGAGGSVPRSFIDLAETVLCHSSPERLDLLYRVLWRLQGDRQLLASRSDPDIRKLEQMAAAVRRDAHKMKAFVRFKSLPDGQGGEQFAAWFEPEHYVVERVAPFFVRRFTGMTWAIVTPYRSALWDGTALRLGAGGSRADVPIEDAMEDSWRTYFASIFNPARLKVAMMKSEMPVKYWRNLPEAVLIPALIRDARQREAEMVTRPATEPPARHKRAVAQAVPIEPTGEIGSLQEARTAVEGCRRCPLHEHATQAVLGEGPPDADVMFVGEQPGDQEDLQGKPFVGPAGQLFDRALEQAGIDRRRTYVTNAVKHFKFVPRGKRRLHQRPNGGEITACRFWLDIERAQVRPRLIVALGATAAQGILGRPVTVGSLRGEPLTLETGEQLYVTVHPSYLLRLRDPAERQAEEAAFAADFKRICGLAAAPLPRVT